MVDDEEDIAIVLQDRLESYGFEVSTAATGLDAIRKIFSEPFDGILMDLKLPELDGIQILELIRKKDRNVPVIVLTAFSNHQQAVEALAKGANDYLIKPFDVRDLKAKIQKVYNVTV